MYYDQLIQSLEHDERVVSKELYLKAPWMYTAVLGKIYILSMRNPLIDDTVLDFVDGRWLTKALKRNPKFKVVDEMLLVRIRGNMGSGSLDGELISRAEYEKDPGGYTVLDTYILAVSRDPPHHVRSLRVDDYQHLKDEYDLVDVGYVVAFHSPDRMDI